MASVGILALWIDRQVFSQETVHMVRQEVHVAECRWLQLQKEILENVMRALLLDHQRQD
jgi:hypothetical protein